MQDREHKPESGRVAGEYLTELRQQGFTVIENVIDAPALERIRAIVRQKSAELDPAPPAFDDRYGVPDSISWSADVCRAVTHPVALEVIRTYLGTEDIHFCHQPAMTVLRPTRDLAGTFPPGGWHADYPYHPGVFPEECWCDEAIYGVQNNLCIDEFRTDNAATQYIPGSHRLHQFPPTDLNTGGTRVGEGPHEHVAQMTAPAGSALVYDSRTWHRACVEGNLSGADRIALLNAVCPSWVRPMVDKTPGTETFRASGMADQLDETTRQELERLCHSETLAPPPGAPQLEAKRGPRRIRI